MHLLVVASMACMAIAVGCVYSNTERNQRDARIGDNLTLTQFTHGRGFTAPENTKMAVCLLHQMPFAVTTMPKGSETKIPLAVDMRLIFLDGRYQSDGKDAFQIPGGQAVTLAELPLGFGVNVLSKEAAQRPVVTTLATTATGSPATPRLRERVGTLVGTIISTLIG